LRRFATIHKDQATAIIAHHFRTIRQYVQALGELGPVGYQPQVLGKKTLAPKAEIYRRRFPAVFLELKLDPLAFIERTQARALHS